MSGKLTAEEMIVALNHILNGKIEDFTFQFEPEISKCLCAFNVIPPEETDAVDYTVVYAPYSPIDGYILRSKDFFGLGIKEGSKDYVAIMNDLKEMRENLAKN